MKSYFPTTIASALLVGLLATAADGQLDITQFGKSKSTDAPILTPSGSTPTFWENLNPFRGRTKNVLTFEQPVATVERLHDNTQKALTQARDAIVKPIRDVQNFRLWPEVPAAESRPVSLVPEWLRPRSSAKTPTPTDWLGKAGN